MMLPVAVGIGDGGQWWTIPIGVNQLLLHFLRPSVCPGLFGLRAVLVMQPLVAGRDTRLNIHRVGTRQGIPRRQHTIFHEVPRQDLQQ